ncbi:MAG: chromosome partitioning protein ParA, partial [Rikenellaceae bacterium]
DYIFFDCPPIDILPDSAIIAPYCNSAIFVIRARLLDKRLLPEIQNAYNSGKYNNMCILLNDVKYEGKGYYGYHKYGYYGYGYGYGYGNEAKKKHKK